MASLFALILTYLTLFTGLFWLYQKIKLRPQQHKKIKQLIETGQHSSDDSQQDNVKSTAWIDAVASFFPVLFVVFFIRSFIVEPFQIPSGSMMKTLLVGDFLTVKKYSYGIRNPLNNDILIPTGHPERGQVAVFKFPLDPKVDYIKRVIGLPGDKVIYDVMKKTVSVFPACEVTQLDCVGNQKVGIDITYGETQPSDWLAVKDLQNNKDTFYTVNEWKTLNLDQSQYAVTRLNMRIESINGLRHFILLNPERMYETQTIVWDVPEGHYFMMGDNRDFSYDSRYWGFVPEQNFVGQASFIWLSLDKQPDQWPTGLRLERLGFIH